MARKAKRPECPWDGAERRPAASDAEIAETACEADAAMRAAAEDVDHSEADWIGWRMETYLDAVVDMAAVCECASEPLRRLAEAWTACRPQDAPFDALRDAMGWPS